MLTKIWNIVRFDLIAIGNKNNQKSEGGVLCLTLLYYAGQTKNDTSNKYISEL